MKVVEGGSRSKNAPEESKGKAAEKPLRPSQCRTHMRERLAEEFPTIVDGFVKRAKTGSCAHVKLATELLEQPEKKRTPRKGSAAQLLTQLSRIEKS